MKKYNNYEKIMIIWGLLTGPLEILILNGIIVLCTKIDFYFNNVLILLVIFAICIRFITFIMQLFLKKKLEDNDKILRCRNLVFLYSQLSITVSFFIFWLIEEKDFFITILLMIPYISVQIPFLIPIKGGLKLLLLDD